MWNKFSDKKPENEQLCLVQSINGKQPSVFTYSIFEEGIDEIYYEWSNYEGDGWDCEGTDMWIICPRLEL